MAKKIGKGQKRIESIKNMRVKFDLEEIFGVTLGGKKALRQALGQAIIDRMESRTKNSKDINDRQFVKYSKQYRESDDFKAAGKTGKVNMTLSGDMLADVDILRDTPKEITIGFNDPDESAKAHGHVTGAVRKDGKARDFFGLSNKDIKAIKQEFLPDLKEAIRLRDEQGKSKLEDALLGILKKVDDGQG